MEVIVITGYASAIPRACRYPIRVGGGKVTVPPYIGIPRENMGRRERQTGEVVGTVGERKKERRVTERLGTAPCQRESRISGV